MHKKLLRSPLKATPSTLSHMHVSPHPLLRRHIVQYTFHLPNAVEHYASKLVPDASGSIACFCHSNGPQLHLWGPSSQIFHAPIHAQSPFCIFVDFRPAGMYSLLKRLPLNEISDKNIPLTVVDKDLSVELKHTVAQFVSIEQVSSILPMSITGVIAKSIPNLSAFIQKLNTIFMQRLLYKSSILSPLLRLILNSSGSIRVAEVARHSGYSSRHLNRLSLQQVGLSVKSFSRVVRINIACEHLKNPTTSLAGLAHELGYYDQSHFINDFKLICKILPSHYLLNPSVFYCESNKLSTLA